MLEYSLNIIGSEWIMIIFVALILLLGTNRFPEAAKKIGKMVGEFNKAKNEIQNEMKDVKNENIEISGPVKNEREKLEIMAKTIGIDSDKMVKKAKGLNRPFNNEKDRKFFLENIKGVDKVFIFNSHKLLKEKLKKLKPDIMIVGAEYKDKKVIGDEHAKELKFFEKIDGYSTTKIIQDIIDRG